VLGLGLEQCYATLNLAVLVLTQMKGNERLMNKKVIKEKGNVNL